MKKFLLAGILVSMATAAKAEAVFDIGYSSYMVVGIRCSTGTAIQINATRPTGFAANVAGYRVVNQDSADSVWVGGVSVSTSSVSGDSIANLGELVAAGASIPLSMGKAYHTPSVPLIPVYCKAADAAGASGAVISVAWFGY